MQAFSSPEPLEAYAREHPVDLLLISEGLLTEEMTRLNVEQIMVLTEEQGSMEGDYPAAYKYQPSENLLKEILSCYTQGEAELPGFWIRRRTEFYGIYSPVKRCGKTAFALMMGKLLAHQGRVLYLNFEEYSGFRTLIGPENKDLSELLMHLLQGRDCIFRKLQELVSSLGNMDYIPPGTCPWDIRELEWEHWERLMESIREEGIYDVVILDLGDTSGELFQILAYCGKIFVPVKEDLVSQAKLEEFQWVCSQTRPGLWERMQQVAPPQDDFWAWGAQEEPQESSLYRYVKRILEEQDER